MGGEVGFTGLLQLAFIILKLTGVIAWPWVFVMMPLIVGSASAIIVLATLVAIAIVVSKKAGA